MTNQDPFGISKGDVSNYMVKGPLGYGKKGKKAQALKTNAKHTFKGEAVGTATGAAAGGAAGSLIGAATGRGAGAGIGGAIVGGVLGNVAGAIHGSRKGYYANKKAGVVKKSAFGIEDLVSKGMKSCTSCGHKHDCSGVSKAVLLPKPFKGLKPIKPKGLKISKPGANAKTDNTSAGGSV